MTTTKKEPLKILAIKVPNDSLAHFSYMGYLQFREPNYETWILEDDLMNPFEVTKHIQKVNDKDLYNVGKPIQLPKGDWKMIGLAHELTDKQWDEIRPYTDFNLHEINPNEHYMILFSNEITIEP